MLGKHPTQWQHNTQNIHQNRAYSGQQSTTNLKNWKHMDCILSWWHSIWKLNNT
jgi:hypothetical protein